MDGTPGGRRTRSYLASLSLLALLLALALAAGSGAAAPSKRVCGAPERDSGGATSLTGGKRSDSLAGGRGADGLDAQSGDDCLSGGAGPDYLGAGSGDDEISGGDGDDQLLAGPGLDDVTAGKGNDLVAVRDGVAETVRCGPGRDLANADEADTLIGCEKVHLFAAESEYFRFYGHFNAYGIGGFFQGGPGKCNPRQSTTASCYGKSEEGTSPFGPGKDITMDWDKTTTGPVGQAVTIKAPERSAVMLGYSDPGWRYVKITGGQVVDFINPDFGVFRTGTDVSTPGVKGGPLEANLSFHSYIAEPQRQGYSLDLRGYLKIIRF